VVSIRHGAKGNLDAVTNDGGLHGMKMITRVVGKYAER
jgi:hypothetical protein